MGERISVHLYGKWLVLTDETSGDFIAREVDVFSVGASVQNVSSQVCFHLRNRSRRSDPNFGHNGPVVTYRAGQNFSEMPGDRHTVDENASKTEPAKLLAVFVVDTDEKELLTPLEK